MSVIQTQYNLAEDHWNQCGWGQTQVTKKEFWQAQVLLEMLFKQQNEKSSLTVLGICAAWLLTLAAMVVLS